MNNRNKRYFQIFIVLQFLLLGYLCKIHAQDTICSFNWNSNSECDAYVPCLDSSIMEGAVLVVPSNVTRISREGLRICLEDITSSEADIVYIMDLSASMLASYSEAGDPYAKRPEALQAAFDYQIANSPESYAGYIGFSINVATEDNIPDDCNCQNCTPFPSGNHILEPVVVGSHATELNHLIEILQIHIDNNERCLGTNYRRALAQAIEWFEDSTLTPHKSKAVIFFSDGAPAGSGSPSPTQTQIDFFANNGIPIYGIFLGDDAGKGTLRSLTDQTDGQYYKVPPENTDTLANVVERIVELITSPFSPTGTTVGANGVTANGVGFQKVDEPEESWQIITDQILPLFPGENTVTVTSQFSSASGDTAITFTFIIDASGPLDMSPECQVCRPVSVLEILDKDGNPLDTLTWEDSGYTLRLTYYGYDGLSAVDVQAITMKGDTEVIRIDNPSTSGDATIFEKYVPFEVTMLSDSARSNNGNTEANLSDTLSVYWQHPIDTLDNAFDSAIVGAPPDEIVIYNGPGDPSLLTAYSISPKADTVSAGTPADLVAKMFANGVWIEEYETDSVLSSEIAWTIVNAATGQPDGSIGILSSVSGAAVTFYPVKAYHTVDITASMFNGFEQIETTIRLYIIPGAPWQLVVEETSDPLETDLNTPQPYNPITIYSNSDSDTAYAVIRDSLGNYIGPSNPTQWSSADTNVVKTQPGQADLGQAAVIRNGLSGQTTISAVDDSTLFSDTVTVILEAYTIDSLRIVVQIGIDKKDIEELVMRTDQDTTLLALGLRSDNGQWEPVDVSWTITGIEMSMPPAGNSWVVFPTDTGSGIIRIERSGVTDEIDVTFLAGLPAEIDIYGSEGDPVSQGLLPYPNPPLEVSARAGDTLELVAKLFDHHHVWLAEYENEPDKSAMINWSVNDNTAGTFLSPVQGHRTFYMPTKAYTEVEITATYLSSNGDTSYTDIVLININPGPAAQLVIEVSPEPSHSPNEARPVGTLTLNSRATSDTVYAILRDKFGNFVGRSNPTDWVSNDTTVVDALAGQPALGEGIIFRVGKSGNTVVTATDRITSLSGDVDVILEAYTIDSLRIVIQKGDSLIDIDELTMRTDQDTTILVLGLRSDNGEWIPVAANWASPGLEISPSAPVGDSTWSFSPIVPGEGKIIVNNSIASDTISVKFNPGLPNYLALYNNGGAPNAVNKYPNTRITVAAGDTLDIVAKIFDMFDYWLSIYETDSTKDSLFSWSVYRGNQTVVDSITGTLIGNGHKTTYMPTVAFRNVDIIASFITEESKTLLSDTLRLYITHGPPDHVVIEASPNAKEASPNSDDPLDTLQITAVDTVNYAYLIVRDRFGNYIKNSAESEWQSLNEDIVITREGSKALGEGKIIRVDSGFAVVTATDIEESQLVIKTDSMVVQVVNYYYTNLRILDISLAPIDSLTMTTNDSTKLFVQGQRSSDGEWEDISALWELSEGLVVEPPPSIGHEWEFSPSVPGVGWIRVYLNNDMTTPDTLWVDFKRGPPVSVTIEIITPPQQRIAGESIEAVVKIRNENGLVPGTWCFPGNSPDSALYSDTLGTGGRPEPTIEIDSVTINLNAGDYTTPNLASECFQYGVDTVSFILYYAPYDEDSLHQITVKLSNTLIASTQPFKLLPARVDSIEIVVDGSPLDTIILDVNTGTLFEAVGYDQYKNFIGSVLSNWKSSDSIPEITFPDSTENIYYSVPELLYETNGYIYARYIDDSTIVDSIYVIIEAKPAELTKAVTLDENGNGYLDAIELTFDKNITIPEGYDPSSITVYYEKEKIMFKVENISVRTDINGNEKYILHLAEDSTLNLPQTDWAPKISLDGIKDVSAIEDFATEDGAGPVIWRVVKKTGDIYDPSNDIVTVTFSEDFQNADGRPFMDAVPNPKPSTVFYVWTILNGEAILLDSVLLGIENFDDKHENILTFKMSNGVDLNGNHYLNIIKDNNLISDLFDNLPNEDNRKVNVSVIGKLGRITVGPNPMIPSLKYYHYEKDKPLEHIEPREAYNRVITSGGVMITVDIKLTLDQFGNILETSNTEVLLMIFDAVGNLVYSKENRDDIIPDEWKQRNFVQGEIKKLCFYWDGISERGMKCAPGCYRIIVWINSNGEKKKSVGTVAVGR